MGATKKEIMADLRYCKESLNRIVKYVDKNYVSDGLYGHHTVIQADIIKLRRELNEVNHKLDYNYKGE